MFIPDEPKGVDLLGDKIYAELLAEKIIEGATPLTIGIFGPWGSGKTNLMLMIKNLLDSKKIKTIWFNAWKQQEEPSYALFQNVLNELKEDDLKQKIKELMTVMAKALSFSLAVGRGVIISFSEFERWMDNEAFTQIQKLREKFEKVVEEYLKKFSISKIVIFIDDIDRCEPVKAIEILQVIKYFLSTPGCVFVISADKKRIIQAIEKTMGSKLSEKFLEKFIQIPFHLRALSTKEIENLIRELSKKYKISEIDRYADIIAAGIEPTPRDVIRFLNIYQLRRAIMERKKLNLSSELFVKLMVIEYRWYLLFEEIRKEILSGKNTSILLRELEKMSCSSNFPLTEKQKGLFQKYLEGDEDLKNFLKRKPHFENKPIVEYFHLAENVPSGEKGLEELVRDIDSENLSLLIECLLHENPTRRREAAIHLAKLPTFILIKVGERDIEKLCEAYEMEKEIPFVKTVIKGIINKLAISSPNKKVRKKAEEILTIIRTV